MPNKRTRLVIAAAAAMLMAVIGAQSNKSNLDASPHRMRGSWRATQIPEGPAPHRRLLLTYTTDGSVLAAAPGHRESVGFGQWIRTAYREFAYTYERLRYDEQGEFVGTVKVRGTASLNENFNQFIGPFINEAFDADGNLVSCLRGTIEASRIGAEPID